ncbi:MAG: hypothetical protein AB1505_21930 [Candidatus Latescibacterota bacterium]
MSRPLRVTLLGNLCDNGLLFARLLRGADLDLTVCMSRHELETCTLPESLPGEGLELAERVRRLGRGQPRIVVWDRRRPPRLLSSLPGVAALWDVLLGLLLALRLRRQDAVVSFAMYHLIAWLSRRPFLAFCTGADLHEVAVARSPKGVLMRRALKRASSVRCTFDRLSRANAVRLRLGQLQPLRIPWPVAAQAPSGSPDGGPIRLFMPSSQDWCNPARHGISKRNDLFLRAWARRVHEGWDSVLTAVAHGPDLEASRRLVCALGVEDRVTWVKRLEQGALQAAIDAADLVADQFDQGVPGALALQTLASARALAIHWDAECSLLAYGSVPPVVGGATEEALYQALRRAATRPELRLLGEEGFAWMQREYDPLRLRAELRLALRLAAGCGLRLGSATHLGHPEGS